MWSGMWLFHAVAISPSCERATLSMAMLSRFGKCSIARLRYGWWRVGIVKDTRLR